MISLRYWCLGAVTATSTLLAGCGSLNVSVDVLDPGHVQQEMADESLRKLYREILSAGPGDFALRVDRQFESFRKELVELAKKVRMTAGKLPPAQRADIERSAKSLEDAVAPGGTYRDASSKNGSDLETLAQKVRDEGVRLRYGKIAPIPTSLREQLVSLQSEERSLRVAQIKDVRALMRNLENLVRVSTQTLAKSAAESAKAAAPAASADAAAAAASTKTAESVTASVAPALAAAQEQAAIAVSVAQRSIIQDGSLAATEFAYVVANAPDPMWKRDFNRAFASGTLGNVDMVIRLNSTADFSVKGLLFDASKVAQVASKVMTQAVLLGAQMSGVPIPTASTGTQSGGDALSKSSADLAASDVVLAKRQAQLSAQRDAIRSLARSVIAASPALASDSLKSKPSGDPEREVVHQGIDTSFSALNALLSMQDLQ